MERSELLNWFFQATNWRSVGLRLSAFYLDIKGIQMWLLVTLNYLLVGYFEAVNKTSRRKRPSSIYVCPYCSCVNKGTVHRVWIWIWNFKNLPVFQRTNIIFTQQTSNIYFSLKTHTSCDNLPWKRNTTIFYCFKRAIKFQRSINERAAYVTGFWILWCFLYKGVTSTVYSGRKCVKLRGGCGLGFVEQRARMHSNRFQNNAIPLVM